MYHNNKIRKTYITDYDVESVNIIVEMPVPVAIIVCEFLRPLNTYPGHWKTNFQ